MAVLLETTKERDMSSQKNVPDAKIELGTTSTRPALYHLIFVWQGLSFLKIFLVDSDLERDKSLCSKEIW